MFRKIVLLAMCLLACASLARAEMLTALEISTQACPEKVAASASGTEWTLYIPGTWDLSAVEVQFSGAEVLQAGEISLRSGQTTDLSALAGQTVDLLADGSRKGTLTVLQGSVLPVVYLQAEEDELAKARKDKEYRVADASVTYVEADGTMTCQGAAELKCRGNSTFSHPKKPYQFKLGEKADLSGMGPHKTWILLANYLDLSLIRNQLMLDLGVHLGVPFAVECRQVDVYINGAYEGLYLLTEKVQLGKERVNITDLEKATEAANDQPLDSYPRRKVESRMFPLMKYFDIPNDPEDITGGYLMEIEKAHRLRNYESNGFYNKLGISVVVKDPEYCSKAQMEYISALFNDFHQALYAKDGFSPETGRYYADFIDRDSFTVKYLMEEFCKNYDAVASSQFLYKDSDAVDGRIFFGPVWDYDLSMGNIRINGFNTGSQPEKEYLTTVQLNNSLYWLLHQHEDFMDGVRSRYRADLAPAVRILLGREEPVPGSPLRALESYAEQIDLSARMNSRRWPEKSIKGYYTASGTTHQASVEYLIDFITRRFAFMEEMWGGE